MLARGRKPSVQCVSLYLVGRARTSPRCLRNMISGTLVVGAQGSKLNKTRCASLKTNRRQGFVYTSSGVYVHVHVT